MARCVILTGFVGDGELRVLVDAAGPPEAPQGEVGGRRRAGRMGRGQRRPVQLHPCRSDPRHGFPQECMYGLLCTLYSISWLSGCGCCLVGSWTGDLSFVLGSLVLRICVAPVE